MINWLEQHLPACMYKKYLGIDCPGCGMQRSFIELLKGDLSESIVLYPALIPMIFMFAYLILHLIFKFEKGALVLKLTFISVTVIIVGSYIFKLIS